MKKELRWFFKAFLGCFFLVFSPYNLKAEIVTTFQQDSIIPADTARNDIDTSYKKNTVYLKESATLVQSMGDSIDVKDAVFSPYISIQQLLKGRASGVYVQEKSGEPGVIQNFTIRGISSPVFKNRDIRGVQPMVYIDGIPLITSHPFVYNIQEYDVAPIGPASNLLAGINTDNIQSIEVIKDPAKLAELGPNAANGAIWITLKDVATSYREVTVDSYVGMTVPESVSPTNGHYENQFRNQFYNLYDISETEHSAPRYLNDYSNDNYFGPSNWKESYYQAKPIYKTNLALSSGSANANFRFTMGRTSDAGNADNTSFNKNNVSFLINMVPFEWVKVSTMVSGATTDRTRNRNFHDRYAETQYLPDLSSPIAPNKAVYNKYLEEHEKSIDDNINNIVRGYIAATINAGELNFSSRFNFDYNEGIRDVFWPSTIMETVNYISNFFSYNQRLLWNNSLDYDFSVNDNHKFNLQAFGAVQNDIHRYNYSQAFNGPNDFIKSSNDSEFNTSRFTDREQMRLLSLGGTFNYTYKDIFNAGGTLRYDGSSNVQSDKSWRINPALYAEVNLAKLIEPEASREIIARFSWAKLGKLIESDRFAAGPQYTVDLGWNQQQRVPSYNGMAALSRPYTSGWIGYDVGWPYTEKMNFDISGSFFDKRLNAFLSFYDNEDKDMLVAVPVPSEYGFTQEFMSGMDVNNKGIDLTLSVDFISSSNSGGFNWSTSFNANYNKNTLTGLPDGRDELVLDNRKLEVGEAIDKFWVYKNQGVYNQENDVPVNPDNERPLNINGLNFQDGDPIWSDENGDFTIDDNDKVLRGNAFPKITGGLINQFTAGNWDLNFHVFFAMGHKALNSRAANRYNFTNLDSQGSISSVSEIYFWQENDNAGEYPLYNPLSQVDPYRVDQDLFLEDLSYIKLRSVRLGYKFSFGKSKKDTENNNGISQLKKAYIYLNGNNLLTLTDFSGKDPELVGFNGYYDGRSLPIPRIISLGLKLDL